MMTVLQAARLMLRHGFTIRPSAEGGFWTRLQRDGSQVHTADWREAVRLGLWLARAEGGSAAIETAFLAFLVSAAILVVLELMSGRLVAVFQHVAGTL